MDHMPRLRTTSLRSELAGPFDFALERGDCLAVTGPSGAGKSLMLRMIADLDPHQGDALLDGVACSQMAAWRWRRKVIYSAAESGWWLDQVSEHFVTPPIDAAARLNLRPDIFGQSMATCSTGERQRLALLRALQYMPPVLLLDEPTGALDRSATEAVEAILSERLAGGTTIVLVTHDEAQAERLGTRRGRMITGQFSWDGR